MRNLILVCVVALAFSATAMAGDIAISTQAGWFGQAAADREMQEIVDNVTAVAVEQFTADDQAALADWVVAHTGDGVSDILILCGNFPDSIYPPGNAQPDGSLAELFLDDGNTIVNTGDYMFYVNNAGANNADVLCNSPLSTIDVNTLLEVGVVGGTWSETTTPNPPSGASFNTLTGLLDGAGLAAGIYTFLYDIPATASCPGDQATGTD